MKKKACFKKISKYKYQLTEQYEYTTNIIGYYGEMDFIKLEKTGKVVIYENYAWDGASGPTIDTLNTIRASLIHDALYQLSRNGCLSNISGEFKYKKFAKYADKVLKKVLLEDNMNNKRANLWYKALRLFNGIAANPKIHHDNFNENDIICIPK